MERRARGIDPTFRRFFAKMFGGNAESWPNMQRTYHLKIPKAELDDALDAIPVLRAA